MNEEKKKQIIDVLSRRVSGFACPIVIKRNILSLVGIRLILFKKIIKVWK